MEVSVKKPGTPEELVHAGVKGMKWGVRKAPTSSGGLRGRQINRQQKYAFNAANITPASKALAIRSARVNMKKLKNEWKAEADPVKRAELKQAYLTHPERPIALRTTRGEKVVAAILLPATPVSTYAVGRTLYRRRVERKQARGSYG